MLFGDGIGFSGLFATHPPILKRIQALEPGFRAEQLERLQAQWHAAPPNGLQEDARMGLAGAHDALPASSSQFNVTPAMVASQVAQPESRSEEHTSELQSLMRISYAVFCLKKKTNKYNKHNITIITHQHN